MRDTRVFVDSELRAGEQARLPDGAARHLLQVLRLRAGDGVILFDGGGRDYPAKILRTGRGDVAVQIADPGEPEPEAPLRVHLGIGISKGERMDFALQKAVELGVSEVTPLFTQRSVVRLSGDRLAKRESHWRGVIIGACEQSGRRRIPPLHGARPLDALLAVERPYPLHLDHSGNQTLSGLAPPRGALTLLIGPEGGLAPGERARAAEAGFTGVRLGPRILRTETAPLAALAVVQALWGDLR
jgi:16S rRNA (uracil1498-N3)-methyltransferase